MPRILPPYLVEISKVNLVGCAVVTTPGCMLRGMTEGSAEVILSIVSDKSERRGTERNNQTSVKVNYRMQGRVDNGKGMGSETYV